MDDAVMDALYQTTVTEQKKAQGKRMHIIGIVIVGTARSLAQHRPA